MIDYYGWTALAWWAVGLILLSVAIGKYLSWCGKDDR